jgi:hypothetical protein
VVSPSRVQIVGAEDMPVNRWLLIRFNMLSNAIVGLVALFAVLNPAMNASLTGFTLTLALSIIEGVKFLPTFIIISLNATFRCNLWFDVLLHWSSPW